VPVPVRKAGASDAAAVAELLDRFNLEFETPTPGPTVLADRLEQLLRGDGLFALLAGEPAVGIALVSLRDNVWFDGPVAVLDELYVVPDQRNHGIGTALLRAVEDESRARGAMLLEINVDGEDTDARRFYERNGYSDRDPGQVEPQLCYHRELG
jgi:GNAT superfamily N-acetyltransferase